MRSLAALHAVETARLERELPSGPAFLRGIQEGRWAPLGELLTADLPWESKSSVLFTAAVEAARAMRDGRVAAATLRPWFLVDGQSILVSPAGVLERALGLRGPVGITWDGEVPVASERWDALGLDGEQDWGRLVGGLQARHGWQLPPPRQARLAARERLPRIFGLS